jgi:lysophospholipase L1-like esterase
MKAFGYRLAKLCRSKWFVAFILLMLAEVLLRGFSIPDRIAWLPEWPAYDQVLLRTALAYRGPFEHPPGKFVTLATDRRAGSRCNDSECGGNWRDESAIRILCAGGSTTWSDQVTDESAYPSQMERILNRDHERKYAAINSGLPGTTSYYFATKGMYDAMKAGPDLVVVGYGGVNDGMDAHFEERRFKPQAKVRQIFRSFQTYRLFEHSAYRYLMYPESVIREPVERFHENLDAIARYFKGYNVGLVFLSETCRKEPTEDKGDRDYRMRMGGYAKVMEKTAERRSIPFVNAAKCLGEGADDLYFADKVHWNEAGCGKIAECVAAAIKNASR